jgi:type IX secretion system substrate protein
MKKIILLILILNSQLSILKSFCQPTIQWAKCFGGSYDDEGYSICQTNDGGYIISGYSLSNDGNLDSSNVGSAWIVKLNSIGAIQWEKSYGTLNRGSYPQSIIQTSDGGYIVAGYTGDSISGYHGLFDAWVCKLNDTGGIQWSKCYGGSHEDYGESIVQTFDGGYIFAGSTNSTDGDVVGNHGNDDYWVVKLNDIGSIQWAKCYGGSSFEEASSIIQTSDTGYIVTGGTISSDGEVTGCFGNNGGEWIVKLDSIGNIQWERCHGGTNGADGFSLLQTSDGGFISGGYTSSNDGDVSGNHGGIDYWIVKLTDTGDIQWQKCLGGSDDDRALSVAITADGKYVIGGYSASTDDEVTGNHGSYDFWVVKLDTNGTMLWEECLGGPGDDELSKMIATNDNGLALIGETSSNGGDVTGHHGINQQQYDYWVVKLNPDSITGIKEVNNNEAVRVYPNPVSNTLNILFPNSQLSILNSQFSITDVLGNTVYHQTLNNLNTSIDVSYLSNGVYFYQLTNNKETQRGKFVVEK